MNWSEQVIKRLKSPHLWLIVVILGFCTVPQYSEQLGISEETSISLLLGFTRHTVERILYLVPIIYAGLVLGPMTGIVISFISMALMLPRALFLSPAPLDVSLEIAMITLFGLLSCLYLRAQRRWMGQKEKDLAQLKQADVDLQASERNYKVLFENANDAIWIHDLEGEITAANEAHARLTGYSVEELSHMNVHGFLSEDSLALAKQVRHRLYQGEIINKPYEQRMVKRDGSEAILRLSTSLITTDGVPTAFYNIARDVTEEERLQENMRFYIRQAVRAQEEERKRIARELHDDTAQVLTSLLRQLDNLIRQKPYLSTGDMFALENLKVELSRGLQGVHRLGQDLRPSLLDDLGLIPALRSVTKSLQQYDGIVTELKILGSERRFSPEVEIGVFRIVQEALSNIRRHAQASESQVVIEFTEDRTKVTISDNGQGFELSGRVGDLPRTGKLGLAGMQERAQLLGGTLEVQSTPSKGTTLVVEIPNQISVL